MEIRLLGPVEVWQGGQQLRLRAGRQLTMVAALALRAGRSVSTIELVDVVWADDPPATVRQQVHTTVSALRWAGFGAVVSTPGGYQLQVSRDQVDAHRFEAAVAAARATSAAGDLTAAVGALRRALALWRGPALAGIPGLGAQAARLDESRLQATEECVELELRLGQHATVVPELTELVAAHPLRERLVGQLMLALYADGRRSEALEVYRQTAKRLAAELGIDPGEPLRALELAVLRADPDLDARVALAGPPPVAAGRVPAPVPEQLPSDVTGFVGRDGSLATLTGLVPPPTANDGGSATPAVVISAVSGTAGVGKTALALHWAHRVRDRFPDGQLFVNLRGFDPSGSEVTPAEAVRGFLDALGVAAQQVPVGLAAQTALYRSLLSGKRMLVVLDNARGSEQVRPLLPGAPGCLVVVTSRSYLDSLVAIEGARPLTIDLLSVDEARRMLEHRLGAERVVAEPEAVDRIIDLCARLPLALAIVSARAAGRPRFPLAVLVEELAGARGGLDALAGGDAAADIRAVFSWSYRTLCDDAARLFRLLGLHPGPDFTVVAAASLADIPPDRARRLLAELTRAHLLDEPRPGRFAFHDLLRSYAAELTHAVDSEPERRAARYRVLDHYMHAAHAADRLLHPHRDPITVPDPRPGVVPVRLTDHRQALAWFTIEHAALSAAWKHTAAERFDTHVGPLTWSLATFFNRRGHFDELAASQQAALVVARRVGDRAEEAHTHRRLARAYLRLGRPDDAHDLGNRYEEADALRLLGETHHTAGSPDAARRAWQRAHEILDGLGHVKAHEIHARLRMLEPPRVTRSRPEGGGRGR